MAISTQYLSGFETGVLATQGGGVFDVVTAGASCLSAAARNGGYGARITAGASTAVHVRKDIAATPRVVERVAVKVTARPSSGTASILMWGDNLGSNAGSISISNTGVLAARVGGGTAVNGPTIDTTGWHLIEVQMDMDVSTLDWKVDGVLQTRATGSAFADIVRNHVGRFITSEATTFTADYDDWIIGTWTSASTDWYGDGKVLGQIAGVDGTHATITSLSPGDAGTAYAGTPTTVYTMVDDAPGSGGWTTTRSTTDNIALRTATVGAYAEIKPATTSESSTANAVRAIMSYSSSATQANLAACDVRNSAGAVTELWGLTGGVGKDYSEGSNFFKGGIVTTPAAGWTASEVNAIRFRFGGCTSADISPVPTAQAMMIEVDWIALSAPSNTVAPALSGSAFTGSALTCSTGTWSGVPTPTFAYQWERDGVDISGATSSTYTTVAGDADKVITCRVTATNSQGSSSADSNTVTPILVDQTLIDNFNRPTGLISVDAGATIWETSSTGYTDGVSFTGTGEAYSLFTLPSTDFDLLGLMLAPGETSDVRMRFNVQTASPLTGYQLIVDVAGYFTLQRVTNGTPTTIAGPTSRTLTIPNDDIYVRKRGSSITVYHNGTSVFTVTDANYSGGKAHLVNNDFGGSWGDLRGGPMIAAVAPENETAIDDFNRADGVLTSSTPAGVWNGSQIYSVSATQLQVMSNVLGKNTSGLNTQEALSALSLGTDFDLLFDIAGSIDINQTIEIYFALSGVRGTSEDGYYFQIDHVGPGLGLNVFTNVVPTEIDYTLYPNPAIGSQFWIRKRGTDIKIYDRSTSAALWIQRLAATDSTYNRTGKFGIAISGSSASTTWRLDNLRGGSIVAGTPYTESPADTMAITDSISFVFGHGEDINDAAGVTDARAFVSTIDRALADTAGITDARALAQSATVADAAGITDSAPTFVKGTATNVSDTAGITDSQATAQGIAATVADTAGVTDSLSSQAAFERTLADAAGITDSTASAQGYASSLADAAGITDLADPVKTVGGVNLTQNVNDSADITDSGVADRPVRRFVAANKDLIHLTAPTFFDGDYTIVAVVRRANTDAFQGIFTIGQTGSGDVSPSIVFEFMPTGIEIVHERNLGNHSYHESSVWQTTAWQLVVITRGGITPHFSQFDGSTWNYVNSLRTAGSDISTIPVDWNTLGAEARIGNWNATWNPFNGEIAVVGLWIGEALDNTEVQSLAGGNAASWIAMGAAHLWELNQDPVIDAVGSLDQTALDGTTLATDVGVPSSMYRFGAAGLTLMSNIFRTQDDAAGITDSQANIRTVASTLTDSANITDVLNSAATLLRSNDDVATITDQQVKASGIAASVNDAAGITDVLASSGVFQRTISDAAGITDQQGLDRGIVTADAAGITDASSSLSAFQRDVTDAAGITDLITPEAAGVTNRTINDTADITDSLSSAGTFFSTLADAAAITDAVGLSQGHLIADAAAITDLAALGIGYAPNLADAIGITDSLARSQGTTATISDLIGVTDALNYAATLLRAISDAAGITDSLTKQFDRGISVADAAAITDARSITGAFARAIADAASIADLATPQPSVAGQKQIDDGIAITDALSRLATYTLLVADSASIADTSSRASDRLLILADSSNITDIVAKLSETSLIFDDLIVITDLVDPFISSGITLNSADMLYLGDEEVDSVYCGGVKVWPPT